MKLYSTLSGRIEEFFPNQDQVKLYVCGITTYDSCHVGHAMSSVIFDVLRRYLEYSGYDVYHVQNFTDIDDKIILRALNEQTTYREISDRYIQEFTEDMDRLNVQRAHVYPLATESIPKMIEIISNLLSNGYAYQTNGNVYFRVTRNPDYGKLSRRSLDTMISGARVEVAEEKEHPMDFTLWKAAKLHEPAWESPWGNGRPGWHIECTAICLSHIGNTVDIHGGGQDLIFPHHENEIAQSESYTNEIPFSRFWMHNGLIQLEDQKMSKSLGNLVKVRQALQTYSADAIRLFFLSSHYRSPLNYNEEAIVAMERAMDRLSNSLRPDSCSYETQLDPEPFKSEFSAAMNMDLNTSQAIAALFNLSHEINRAKNRKQSVDRAQETLKVLANVLGITFRKQIDYEDKPSAGLTTLFMSTRGKLEDSGLHELAKWVEFHQDTQDTLSIIETLIAVRRELRQIKDYQLADMIRYGLSELGINLEDTKDRTVWTHHNQST